MCQCWQEKGRNWMGMGDEGRRYGALINKSVKVKLMYECANVGRRRCGIAGMRAGDTGH